MRAINAAYEALRGTTAPAPAANGNGVRGQADGGQRQVRGDWLAPEKRRALGQELLAVLERDERVLVIADAATWDSLEVRLAVTDRRLLWLRDDAFVGRVRSLRYTEIDRVEGRLRRPRRRVGELRVHPRGDRILSFAGLSPERLQAILRMVAPRVAGAPVS
jgi:hypothetical protein